jgi:hypothetical protein
MCVYLESLSSKTGGCTPTTNDDVGGCRLGCCVDDGEGKLGRGIRYGDNDS